MPVTTRQTLWAAAHAERAALARDLAELDEAQWAEPSLCGRWSVAEVRTAMAGRAAFCADLTGPGVPVLSGRCART